MKKQTVKRRGIVFKSSLSRFSNVGGLFTSSRLFTIQEEHTRLQEDRRFIFISRFVACHRRYSFRAHEPIFISFKGQTDFFIENSCCRYGTRRAENILLELRRYSSYASENDINIPNRVPTYYYRKMCRVLGVN